METEKRLSRKTSQYLQTIGAVVLFYTLIDWLFLKEVHHESITFPLGIMFLIISQSNPLIRNVGERGIIGLILAGTILLIILLALYYMIL